MSHRLREAMRATGLEPMGGEGSVIEADETYFGAKDEITTRTKRGKPGLASKRAVVWLVERGATVRSMHVERATKVEITRIVEENVAKEATLYTDESRLYDSAKGHVSAHFSVRHAAGEYVRDEVHTNTIEGFFSIFKRGMNVIYQHCGEKHLHRYLAEFDFRYNNHVKLGDVARADVLVRGIVGKRLTYRTVSSRA